MPRKIEPIHSFPRRLRMAMTLRKMNSMDIVRASTVGCKQISNYLNGHNEPTVSSLLHLCEALDVSADFLLGLSDDPRIKIKRKADNNG